MKKSTSRKKRNLLQNILYGIYLLVSWIVKKVKSIKFSKKIVVLVIVMNIIFTLKVFDVFQNTGSEPMTLVGAWFGFTTVELWSLSKIKRNEDELASQHYNNDDDYLGG